MGNASINRSLTSAELDYVAKVLGITIAHLDQIYVDFLNVSGDGKMNKKGFRHFYKRIAPWGIKTSPRKVKRVVDKIYEHFDFDGDGYLQFNEFLAAMVMLHGRGDPREKMQFLLRCNHPDGIVPPTISAEAVRRMLRALDNFYNIGSYDNIHDTIFAHYPDAVDIPTAQVIDIINADYRFGPILTNMYEGSSSGVETE